jgi:ubiquinol-cytochrome c reductase cytochrome b subunit
MNSLSKLWKWTDDRTGITEITKFAFGHLAPPESKWLYVFGSATLFSFILQVITGIALAFMYQPSAENAYESLIYITQHAPLGKLLRGLHFFGASSMILFVGIHMLRIYLMSAYKYPREMSWLTGVVLLLLTVTMGFTGQLLRWDANGVWSVVVGAEQAGRVPFLGRALAHFLLGGETIGATTLSRYYAIHVFLIPALLLGLIGLHLYLILRNGISEPPVAGRKVEKPGYRKWYESMLAEKGVPFWPDAAWRDATFGIIVVTGIFLLALIFGPPEIGTPPDPANINANPRPDWYFMWIFALFALMPPQIESFVIAFSPVVIGIILISLPILQSTGERSPFRRPWKIGIAIILLTVVATFWYIGSKSPWSPRFDTKPLSASIVGNVSPSALRGSELFYSKACIYCHTISGEGGRRGPDLSNIGNMLTREQMVIKIVNGGGNMPALGATVAAKDLDALADFLQTRRE